MSAVNCCGVLAAGAFADGACFCAAGVGCGAGPALRWQAASNPTAHSASTLGFIMAPMISHIRRRSQLERRGAHRRQLLLKRPVVLLPVARLGEPRECLR